MNDILHDLTTPHLVHAIEENLYCFMTALRCWPRAEVHEEPCMKWSITDLPFSLFNSVMRAQLPTGAVDATIDAVIERARRRGVPVSWWTGPATRPSDLGMHLQRHGFGNGECSPGMALDLGKLTRGRAKPPGLKVEVARDEASLQQWGLVCARGFGAPENIAGRLADVWCDFLGCADPHAIVPYLGSLADRPVATSMLMLGAGVAGIYAVATLPEARRQGVGATMTAEPLYAARDAGYAAGILHASEMGVGVYRSLGFREYCKIYEYVWKPAVA